MSFLQIAEPGSSNRKGDVIGIDLGTTNSLVARVVDGKAQIIKDQSGEQLMPSVVHFPEEGAPIIGSQARQMLARDPENTIASVKRLMGLPSDAPETELFASINRDQPVPRLATRAGLFTPQEISAHILNALKQRALQQIEKIDGAVITVPAYFDDSQRQATKDAARLAGIPLMRLLNEPTAAALAYGIERNRDGIVAVYDFGGGTFDISVLRLEEGIFQVLATAGDTRLGGDDIDRIIADWIAQATVQLPDLQQARAVKQQLSEVDKVTIEDELTLDRQTFNTLVQHLIDRTVALCHQAIADSGAATDQIHSLVLVGGSTRMPIVTQELRRQFPDTRLYNEHNPDTSVALGAALQAAMLSGHSGKNSDRLLLDVLPLSLGIETMGSLVERIIPRNSTIPAARTQEFTTWKEGQSAMLIHVVQGERDKVEDCRSLAKFTLRGIPPAAAGAARIEVTFSVDADGILQVTAVETSTGTQAHVEVQPSSGLSEEQIRQMLEDAWQGADDDLIMRKTEEAAVEAGRVINATRVALAEDGEMLTEQDKTAIEASLQQLEDAVHKQDGEQIERCTEQLIESTNDFAARRMDKAIAQTLSGKSIDD